jgi:glycosyltransferase involved in cell wall biosynthesis
MMNAKRKIWVLSSGSHPEPVQAAVGLSRRGHDVRFLTSSLWPHDHILMRSAHATSSRRLSRELLRRRLPATLPRHAIQRLASTHEVAAFIGSRVAPRHSEILIDRRTKAFRTQAARAFRATRTDAPGVVISQYTSALEVFRESARAKKVLLYPIAHHRWMETYLHEEARRNAEWAPFLQGHDIVGHDAMRLDEEIFLADAIIVPSSFAKETFISAGVASEKLRVVALGTDVREQPESAGSHDSFRILFAGQVNQRKGIGYLLDAVASADIPGAELWIAGPASDQIRTKILQRHDNVRFLGSMPRSALKEVMASCSVMVMPSLAEGFGLVAIEAMSAGTPAIVTPHTFATDIITDGIDGWITPAAQSDLLAQLLVKISRDQDNLRRVSRMALRTAADHTWDHYQELFSLSLEDIIST